MPPKNVHYQPQCNWNKDSFTFFGGKAEANALIDSGATENFIDHKTIIKLQLGTRKLQKLRTVYNVNRTLNCNRTITQSCKLFVKQGNKRVQQQFFITNLGKNELILGYPWLCKFNPDIDWKLAIIKGPKIELETITKGRNILQKTAARIIPQLEEGDKLHYEI